MYTDGPADPPLRWYEAVTLVLFCVLGWVAIATALILLDRWLGLTGWALDLIGRL